MSHDRFDPESRRRQILFAAHRSFARGGFHGTTMQDVADEAGLSVGALYRYFDGKESLIAALAAWGSAQKASMLDDLVPGGGSRELGSVLRRILAFLATPGAERAASLDVRLWGEALGDSSLTDLVARGLAGLRTPLATYLATEREAGRLDAGLDPAAAARVLVGVLLGLELQKALDPSLDVDACARELARMVEGLGHAPETGS